MKNYKDLEEGIGKRGGMRNARFFVALSVAFIVAGSALLGWGVLTVKNNQASVSADPQETPPVPANPTPSDQPPNPAVSSGEGTPASPGGIGTEDGAPPSPGSPASGEIASPPTPQEPGGPIGEDGWQFPAGWSMISGEFLTGRDMAAFSKESLILYSFNDPVLPNRDWLTYPAGDTSGQTIIPMKPLGYYVYNPKSESIIAQLPKKENPKPNETIFGRGWHIVYWGGPSATKEEVLSKLTIKYSDGTTISAKEAITSAQHKTSLRIYVVVNERVIDLSSAVKELTGQNSDKTISRVPAKSYLWIYLRRTKNRVVEMSFPDEISSSSVSDQDKAKIDAWLSKSNLNECGDSPGTVYTGGSCLFDETTGKTKDKYENIISKFPDKPWLKS